MGGTKHTADRAALRTLAAALAVAPAAFLFAAPWPPDIELSRVALQQALLLALCALAGGCVLSLACRGHRAARAALAHPAVLLPLAAAALALVLAPSHPLPWRTLSGLPNSPYHHSGALLSAETALLAAGYLAAARGSLRLPLASALAVSVLAAGGLTAVTVTFDRPPWLSTHLPQWYNFVATTFVPSSYFAWIAPAGLAAAAALARAGRGAAIAAGALLAWALWVSGNSTAAIGAAGALLFAAGARTFPRLERFGVRAAVCALILLLPPLLVPAAAPLIERADVKGVDAAALARADGIPSRDPRDHVEINMMPGRTMWSRSWMQRVVLADLAAHPALLATGRGWGTFAESQAARWRDVPGRRAEAPAALSSRTHWDGHDQARFHPHNVLVEALSSLGIVGALLTAAWLALPMLLPRRPTGVPFLFGATLCTVAGFWFLESSAAPLFAAAYAASVRPLRIAVRPAGAKVARAAFAGGVLLCLSGCALSLFQLRPAPVAGCPAAARASADLFSRYGWLLSRGAETEVPLAWLADHVGEIDAMACAARAAGAPGHGLEALADMLELRDLLLTGFDGLPAEAFPSESAAWKGDLVRLLDAAPGRTDAIVPYVARTVSTKDRETAGREIAALRARVVRADDPVGAWLDACRAFLDGDADGHRANGLRALELGIANLVAPRHAHACAPRPSGPGPLHSAGEGATTIR